VAARIYRFANPRTRSALPEAMAARSEIPDEFADSGGDSVTRMLYSRDVRSGLPVTKKPVTLAHGRNGKR
jgi:hypothetical protein